MNRRNVLQSLGLMAAALATGTPALAGAFNKDRAVFKVVDSDDGFVMDRVNFLDLKNGDRFCLYESTGELVVDTMDPAAVWECQEDAYLKEGVGTVYCEPVKDTFHDLPKVCPS
jgi:hypothetical protein